MTAVPIVDLEAHMMTESVLSAWQQVEPAWRDLALEHSQAEPVHARLTGLGDARIAAMDAAGVDVQVLSLTTPGLQNLPADQAVSLQTEVNDQLAEAVRAHPDRFHAFATLATAQPEQAAAELGRAVGTLGLDGVMLFGRTRDQNIDDQRFWPIYEAAEALRAPIYLHPQSPPVAVRQAYYEGYDHATDLAFATHGVGWDYETGVQILRLILGGVLDRFPDLRIVASHWGEMVLFYLDRIDQLTFAPAVKRAPSEYFQQNVWVTPAGVFSGRYLRWARELLGIERIMFASDYPFVDSTGGRARDFVEQADLPPAERAAFAADNWNRLRAEIRR